MGEPAVDASAVPPPSRQLDIDVPVSLSMLDEARFGIRTARAPAFTAEMLPGILAFCVDHRVRLLIARSAGTDTATLRAARQSDLQQMDALMYWSADLRRPPRDSSVSLEHVRPAASGEAEQVRTLAIRAFRGYGGHYHADSELDDALCDEAYGDWACRSCSDESPDHVLVAEVDGRIAGFASVRLLSSGDALAVLSGVDPAFRRRGVYASLHLGRLLWCRAQGATRMVSPTLATNVMTQRTYVQAGLVHDHACHTFHKWFDGRP